MIWVYIAAAIFGGAFAIPMILGGLDFDGDVDIDVDGDLELDSPDGGSDALGDAGGAADFLGSLLSFRSIVLALAFFGLSGIVLSVFDTAAAVTLIAAIGLGVFAAATNAAAMRYVLGNEASSHLTNADIRGTRGTVVLPLGPDRRGRIRTEIAGQTEYFTALPLRSGTAAFDVGDEVVIVEIDKGTAKVAPLSSDD